MSPERKDGEGNTLAVDAGVVGGSTGGASLSDLARGYVDCDEHRYDPDGYFGAMDAGMAPEGEQRPHGFLDRPQGWER